MLLLSLLVGLTAAHSDGSGQCDAEGALPAAMGGTINNMGWSLSANPSGFTLNTPITVTVNGPTGNFMGIQMYVEDPTSNTKYGSWAPTPGFKASSACTVGNAITHSSSASKSLPMNFTWNGPATDPGVSSLSVRALILSQGPSPRVWAQLSSSLANNNVASPAPSQAPSTIAPTTAAPTMGPTCTDGMKGPEEVGVDCGGPCPACPTYVWSPQPYTPCSTTCGGGIQTRIVLCVDGATGDQVAPANCSSLHPAETSITCNPDPCPSYQWSTGDWSECSSPCNTGTQTRLIVCLSSLGNSTVEDVHCGAVTKPFSSRECNTQQCTQARWVSFPWDSCSVSCGGGTQSRTVQCQDASNTLTSNNNCMESPPPSQQTCNTFSCVVYVWNPCPTFYPCTATCNGGSGMLGVRYKDVYCVASTTLETVDPSLCNEATKPITNVSSCNPQPCTGPNWMANGNWGPCEFSTDPPFAFVRRRTFHCHAADGSVALDSECASVPLPVSYLACTPNTCLKNVPEMVSLAPTFSISIIAMLLIFWNVQ